MDHILRESRKRKKFIGTAANAILTGGWKSKRGLGLGPLFAGMMVMMIRKLPSKCYDEFANLLSVLEEGINRGEGERIVKGKDSLLILIRITNLTTGHVTGLVENVPHTLLGSSTFY